MGKIRVLIADDSVVMRRLVSECLAECPEIEIAGTAANGRIALAKLEQINPDLVTLDVEMPEMNGLETLAAIRKTRPKLPIIMFSTLTIRGALTTLDALALGASDYVTKPTESGSPAASMQRIRDELVPKIRSLCRRPGPVCSTRCGVDDSAPAEVQIVAIGVSTGGPNALSTLLPNLARQFPVPIVLVQHMPPLFTRMLAERLTAISGFPTREAEEGVLLQPGEVWIAPGGFHLETCRTPQGVVLHLHQGPYENSCRPAVDVLFRSIAQVFGRGALAVVLTGMGQDGMRGCECIREAGGRVLAQDESTSVVWGMPGAIAHAGLANKIVPLPEMAAEINARVFATRISTPAILRSRLQATIGAS